MKRARAIADFDSQTSDSVAAAKAAQRRDRDEVFRKTGLVITEDGRILEPRTLTAPFADLPESPKRDAALLRWRKS